MAILRIRCQAKTEDTFRIIEVDVDNSVATCSCNQQTLGSFCAHIDAVLIAGERYMVPASDHKNADRAMKLMTGYLIAPPDWKGSWRSRMIWRGLSKPRTYVDHTAAHGDDYHDRPTICFTGKGPMSRSDILEHARQSGWKAVDSLIQDLKVLVAEDPTLTTSKLQGARRKGIPVISYDEYLLLNADSPKRN
jgi:NAD-dependent DNA ligase